LNFAGKSGERGEKKKRNKTGKRERGRYLGKRKYIFVRKKPGSIDNPPRQV